MDQGRHAEPKFREGGKVDTGTQVETGTGYATAFRVQGLGQLEIQTLSLDWLAEYHFSGLTQTGTTGNDGWSQDRSWLLQP